MLDVHGFFDNAIARVTASSFDQELGDYPSDLCAP
jgi:hypothetical protein